MEGNASVYQVHVCCKSYDRRGEGEVFRGDTSLLLSFVMLVGDGIVNRGGGEAERGEGVI